MKDNLLHSYFQTYVPLVEEEMRRAVNAPLGPAALQPAAFNTMLNYHLGFAEADGSPVDFKSGKRIRPILTLLCCEACGADPRLALGAAAAVELLHNFSLIHDDIEDRDELRRGRSTLWKIWGEAQAINAGDAMFSIAHLALERSVDAGVPAERVLRALILFDTTCLHLTVGQHLDLDFENRGDVTAAKYLAMIEGKTAALTRAACEIGAIVAGAPAEQTAALGEFGKWLGIAFQLQDDVLGIWGDPTVTGKQDSDLAHGKRTLPVLFAAERDPVVREQYLRNDTPEPRDITHVKARIEASGARAHTEQAAHDAHGRAVAALEAAAVGGRAADALRMLVESLLGREA